MTNMKHLRTATVSGGAEVNRAIGTLVSAFEIDPVARWNADPADTMVAAGGG